MEHRANELFSAQNMPSVVQLVSKVVLFLIWKARPILLLRLGSIGIISQFL